MASDPKDDNLSPIGRKWDNTPAPRKPKWSVGYAALFGFGIAGALLFAHILVDGQTGRQESSDDLIVLLVKLGLIPLFLVIVAMIRSSRVGLPSDES
jgi:hypothetical protein